MTSAAFRDTAAVEPWPSERPLFALSLLIALAIWLLAVVTIVGIVYAAMFGLFFFVMHLAFIAHVRGSGVRLGPDQFPELHADVERIAHKLGLPTVPETYVMQAGGTLNAFATRFLGTNIVVLFSDLLDACGDNRAARDMIIAHELGHVKEGHLRWHWVLLPSQIVPFLGSALSRAREYTCDRYGLAGAGDLDGALTGLTILAAGASHGPGVNRAALVRQRQQISGAFMTLGQWLSTHPPLAKRLAALDPRLGAGQQVATSGPLLAAALIVLFFGGIMGIGVAAAVAIPQLAQDPALSGLEVAPGHDYTSMMSGEGGILTAERTAGEMARLVDFIRAEHAAGRGTPADAEELYARWTEAHPAEAEPTDPYDGLRLGYARDEAGYFVWSSGPDGEPGTDDDVHQRIELP